MARKEFTYRGLKMEQLAELSDSEFARLVTSRERRSILRGFTNDEKSLLRKLAKKDKVKTQCREMVVVPRMVGKTILVHTGKDYSPIEILPDHLGTRLGQLAMTRKIAKHASPGVAKTATRK